MASKVGRPKFEITPEVIKQAESLAAQGLTQDQIAATLGCATSTLMDKKLKYAEFSDAIKRGRSKGIATITNSLFQKAKGGDNVSMIFYLKNRDPQNWSDKQDHNHEVKSDISFNVTKKALEDVASKL